ncbi:hypothetical protein B0O80DRAFT_384843 [Mortierella sp. GBAus27b]|nr:hypothetical protein BGX31_001079 [Mortierella sp. GBA43]KAI8356566.1 hypothetical protein B0O80DRAFT_384843 [Mortierella sp. GBAus27b]
MKKLGLETQTSILNHLRTGHSVKETAKRTGCSQGAVSSIRTQFLPTLPRQATGRPNVLSARTMNDIKRKMMTGVLKTGVEVHKYLTDHGTDISYRSVLNNLKKIGFKAHRKSKCVG